MVNLIGLFPIMEGVGYAMNLQHHRSLHSGIDTLHDSKEQNESP